MQKIFVEKNEIIAEVIERILETPDSEITLVIPKESLLNESGSNFSLLSREAKALDKKIIIESVDEKTLTFAKTHKLEAIHPLFGEGGHGERSFSDIVPLAHREEKGRKKNAGVKVKVHVSPREERDEVREEYEEHDEPSPEARKLEVEDDGYGDEARRSKRTFPWKSAGIVLAVLVLGAVVFWSFGAYWSTAEVTIRFKQTSWEYQNTFTASAVLAKANAEKNLLPAQLFEDQKSLTQFFPATGRSSVSEKSRGTITIYNAYSSAPQTLVKTTRFETPDGKIFRLENQIIVPGAKITNGKIEPASIKGSVIADKPGPEYNLGAISKLTIPGLKGSPKFAGFYGALEDGTSGGSSGDRSVPTDDDIAKAKNRVNELLTSAFKATFLSAIPKDLKVLDGATSFEVTKLTINRTTDAQNNFSIIAVGSFKAIVFREADLVRVLEERARKSYPDLSIASNSLVYTNVRPDFAKKELAFSLAAQTSLAPALSHDQFVASLAGKDVREARTIIEKLPELGDAKLSVWPSWVRRLPGTVERITLTIQ